MRFLKNIFSKCYSKKVSDSWNVKSKDLALEHIKKIGSLGDEKIENYKKMLKEFKPTNETQKLFLEVIKEGIAHNKLSKAQKIVNDYGKALMEATDHRRKKVDEFNKNFDSASLKVLQEKKDIYYYLQNKFDIRLLPYDKETIRESIELLLQEETDSDWLEQLRIGLLYLEDFIDFNQSHQ